METNIEGYFENLEKDVKKVYEIANNVRSKGLDPISKVEIPLAKSLAEKCVGLIATIYPQMANSGITERILELEKDYGKLDTTVSFKIAEEVAKQKFCKFDSLIQAIDAGIRMGFAYTTLGVVSSPIEGFTEIKLGKTKDGKEYFKAYFSGPIRSAGTTASCVVLMIIDYLREVFGFAKYDPSDEEVRRYITENYDYHERVTNLQYLPLEKEIEFLAKNLPIEICGDPTEKIEVSNYKNLPRVETNFIRGGMCLVFSEGLAQKAKKGFRLYNGVKSNGVNASGWDFLEGFLDLQKKLTSGKSKDKDTTPTYIRDLVAGRPVYGHPSRSGSFRFRYGRGRVSGFSAFSVHPATMAITDDFIALGTQLKIEKPTKGGVVTPNDKIEGPIVKFYNGSVKKINSKEEAKLKYKDVEEIIYLGDVLFPFSDLLNRNYDLLKPGYVEEWWKLDLKSKGFNEEIDEFNVSFKDALDLSLKYNIPLHPNFILYWTQINNSQFLSLLKWLKKGFIKDKKIILPYHLDERENLNESKRALELIGLEHDVFIENVVISEINSLILLTNLGLSEELLNKIDFPLNNSFNIEDYNLEKEVLEIINQFTNFLIKDKAGDFMGARMGRPEKAKLRRLTGNPNSLFPVGNEGGRLRSINEAYSKGFVKSQFPLFYCESCGKERIYPQCNLCGNKCQKQYYYNSTKEKSFEPIIGENKGFPTLTYNVDIKHYFDDALKKINYSLQEAPNLIKSVRGLSSTNKIPEHLEKGILRAKYNLPVNKDGTIRYDVTEMPVTSFKPKEVSVSVAKLKEIGYVKDIYGNELVDENQILELMPHDILLPSCPDSPDEKADDVFLKMASFIDELLVRFYKTKPFYNLKNKEDLVGHLGVCMAPHNCAGVICRFIGFSKSQGLLASPYMHAAMRRDCFSYDTYFPIKENGIWNISKIGDIVERLNPEKIVDSFGTKEKKVTEFETIGFKDKFIPVKVNNFTKHTKQNLLEFKTALGKKITVTENHKFFIEGKLKTASQLKIGDKVSLPYNLNIPSNNLTKINLFEQLLSEDLMVRDINKIINKMNKSEIFEIVSKLNWKNKSFKNYHLRDSYPLEFVNNLPNQIKNEIFLNGKLSAKRDNVKVPIIINLDKNLLEVIGLYIAEGYSRSVLGKKGLNQVYISSCDAEIRKFVAGVILKHFGLKPTENKTDRVTFSSKVLYLFFTKVLKSGSKARDKRVPNIFLDLPLSKLASVLRGYFEGDGSAEKRRKKIACDSVSEGLLHDLEFCLARFGIFAKRYEYEKEPGEKLKSFYLKKKVSIPMFKITKLIISGDFVDKFNQIGFLSKRKNDILNSYRFIKKKKTKINYDENFIYDPIVSIEELEPDFSYCLNVNTKNHLVIGNSIVSKQCDGDEAAIMLLSDVLINFSREFLPSHRGGTQDAPLVLNGRIEAGEVDDQILDFELVGETYSYPLELYQKAEKRLHSSEIKEVKIVKHALKEGKSPFLKIGFTHDTDDINDGVFCSSYKKLATMKDKVEHQMNLVEKIRAVDTSDTARLIIERHFVRDMRGNLRKFSMQGFRCVSCNEILRRPPLTGICPHCSGKIIFTIHEGGIKKYLDPTIDLINKYNLSNYLKQSIEVTKRYIEAVFGKENEKQEALERWF